MKRSHLLGGGVLVATALVGYMLVPAAPAVAAPHGPQWQHIVDCWALMFSNPAKHARLCGPGHDYFIPWPKGPNVAPPAPPAPSIDCTNYADLMDGQPRLIEVVELCDSSRVQG